MAPSYEIALLLSTVAGIDTHLATSLKDRMIAATAVQKLLAEESKPITNFKKDDKVFVKSEAAGVGEPTDSRHIMLSAMDDIGLDTRLTWTT